VGTGPMATVVGAWVVALVPIVWAAASLQSPAVAPGSAGGDVGAAVATRDTKDSLTTCTRLIEWMCVRNRSLDATIHSSKET
jgi:hypothetical protein